MQLYFTELKPNFPRLTPNFNPKSKNKTKKKNPNYYFCFATFLIPKTLVL